MPVASLAGIINLPMEYLGYDIPNLQDQSFPGLTAGNKAGFGNTGGGANYPFYFVCFDRQTWRGIHGTEQTGLYGKPNNFVVTDGMYAYFSYLSENSVNNYAFGAIQIPQVKNSFVTIPNVPLSSLVPPDATTYEYDASEAYGIGYDGVSVALGAAIENNLSDVFNVNFGNFGTAQDIKVPYTFVPSSPTLFNGFIALSYSTFYYQSPDTKTIWASAYSNDVQPEPFSFDNANFNSSLLSYGLKGTSVAGGFILSLLMSSGNYVYVFIPGWGFGYVYYIINFLPTDAASESILTGGVYDIAVTNDGDIFLGESGGSQNYKSGYYTLLKNVKGIAGPGAPLVAPVGSPFSFKRLCCNTANGTR